ncbi:TetR/AcrR family transcriptional regulator [Mesobacillus harenae]|uniref:TetR/AcrR family transcriptional regulator n=1 Tax=Mesobacillus harenae TaxID=2213203 RepID=UPI00157FDB37|nr:TetR/AcrR family transcriptional regulator [Mesobacillus harenae]
MKQKIIKTSIQLFDERGFSGTSVQEIVETIGVTKGTFYYYFKSKQELLKLIHLNYIEDLIIQQEKILQDPEKCHKDKLHEIVFMLISNIKTQRPSARIFFREMRHLTEQHVEEIRVKRNIFRENYQTMVEEGVRAGEFSQAARPDIITFGILGITNWSYYWYNPDGNISEQELTKAYTDMIFNGILNVQK